MISTEIDGGRGNHHIRNTGSWIVIPFPSQRLNALQFALSIRLLIQSVVGEYQTVVPELFINWCLGGFT